MTFKKHLLEAIDESFSLLGESGKLAIYFYLEDNYDITKQDIPDKIESFAAALEDVFGMGAKLIEIQMMKKLFHKMGYISLNFQCQEDLEFFKYVDAARAKSECTRSLVLCS